MGIFWSSSQPAQTNQPAEAEGKKSTVPAIQQVDIVKSKLKVVRDKLNNYIDSKHKQHEEISQQIVAKYLKDHQKRQLLGMLRTKKELEEAIANGEVRLQAVKKSLGQVEQQHLDVQMVEVLDGANKYMASVQEKLEEMDWRAVVMQSQQQYDGMKWNTEEEEEDEEFKKLWKNLGGDKLDKQDEALTRKAPNSIEITNTDPITQPSNQLSVTPVKVEVKEVVLNDLRQAAKQQKTSDLLEC